MKQYISFNGRPRRFLFSIHFDFLQSQSVSVALCDELGQRVQGHYRNFTIN